MEMTPTKRREEMRETKGGKLYVRGEKRKAARRKTYVNGGDTLGNEGKLLLQWDVCEREREGTDKSELARSHKNSLGSVLTVLR